MSDADLLRQAAALMRERAQAATSGPWVTEQRPGRSRHVVRTEAWREQTGCRERVVEVRHVNGTADATHIASWHPAVALAVADWLDAEAATVCCSDGCTEGIWGEGACSQAPALAVARAFLGATP